MSHARIVAIGGGSSSGKSSIADSLAAACNKAAGIAFATVQKLDSFYIGLRDGETPETRNWDDPASLNWGQIRSTIASLKSGISCDVPIYDYALHKPSDVVRHVKSTPLVIIEGIHALHANIRDECDELIFIDCDPTIMLGRRIARDEVQRGRSKESIIKQYFEQVEPAYNAHILPTREHVKPSFCIENSGNDGVEKLINDSCCHIVDCCVALTL